MPTVRTRPECLCSKIVRQHTIYFQLWHAVLQFVWSLFRGMIHVRIYALNAEYYTWQAWTGTLCLWGKLHAWVDCVPMSSFRTILSSAGDRATIQACKAGTKGRGSPCEWWTLDGDAVGRAASCSIDCGRIPFEWNSTRWQQDIMEQKHQKWYHE